MYQSSTAAFGSQMSASQNVMPYLVLDGVVVPLQLTGVNVHAKAAEAIVALQARGLVACRDLLYLKHECLCTDASPLCCPDALRMQI
jgi:hypothetical protein